MPSYITGSCGSYLDNPHALTHPWSVPGDQTGSRDSLLQERVGGEERNVRERDGGREERKKEKERERWCFD